MLSACERESFTAASVGAKRSPASELYLDTTRAFVNARITLTRRVEVTGAAPKLPSNAPARFRALTEATRSVEQAKHFRIAVGYGREGTTVGRIERLDPYEPAGYGATGSIKRMDIADGQLKAWDDNGRLLVEQPLPPDADVTRLILGGSSPGDGAPRSREQPGTGNLVAISAREHDGAVRVVRRTLGADAISAGLDQATAGSERGSAEQRTTYVFSQGEWALQSRETETYGRNGGVGVHNVTAFRVDSGRVKRVDTGRSGDGAASLPTARALLELAKGRITGSAPPTRNLTGARSGKTESVVLNYNGQHDIVLQHGIFSGPETWSSFGDTVIPQALAPHATHRWDTYQSARLGTQAATLKQYIDSNVTQSKTVVLLGHSQGGLVARKVAQDYAASGARLIGGVLTIDSPNQGAYMNSWTGAMIAGELAGFIMYTAYDYCPHDPLAYAGCVLDSVLNGLAMGAGFYQFFIRWEPAALDSQIGSPFLESLNSAMEPYPVAGVRNMVPVRWSLFRLMGDLTGDGAYTVDFMDQLFWTSTMAYCVMTALWPDDPRADQFGKLSISLDAVDFVWNEITGMYQWGGDGFIDAGSQLYPFTWGGPSVGVNYPTDYLIAYSDNGTGTPGFNSGRFAGSLLSNSHTGATRGGATQRASLWIMNQRFGVPPAAP